MSDIELNIIDIKKKLIAEKLYKPEMTLIEMKQVYNSFKYKQAIEAEGLYETGMSDQDIKDIYNTLKKSEESAGNDNEYRDILNRTETNCANIDMLIDESSTVNNDEMVDVTTVQPVSPKPQSASKSFSSFFKKTVEKQPTIKSINVLMEVETNHPLLKLRDMHYSNTSLIYYHQTKILKLPLKERATVISQYLLNLNKYHKNGTKSKMKWSIPIQPQQKKQFNGDLCVDFIPDAPAQEVEQEAVESSKIDETESPAKDNCYSSTRPKRVVKRKTYVDHVTDDEDDFAAAKKTKSNDDLNLSCDNSPAESKWFYRKKKPNPKPPVYMSSGSDRINKIFDALKWGDDSSNSKTEKKSTAQCLQDTLNLSDSDEDCFPTKDLVTTVNIHEDEHVMKSKNAKTVKAKKTSPKKRGANNKLAVQKKSATKENESPEIPTVNFYANNKNTEVDESNNNKLEKNEELTNCPICNRPFPVSEIEVHASNCIQYEGKDSETYCDICNENIPDKKLQSHRYECLKKITDDSIVVDKPVTRSQRNNGFLCEVCDKYICNANEIQHASNCIAKV